MKTHRNGAPGGSPEGPGAEGLCGPALSDPAHSLPASPLPGIVAPVTGECVQPACLSVWSPQSALGQPPHGPPTAHSAFCSVRRTVVLLGALTS